MRWRTKLYYRLWQDLFMGSRLGEYSALLERLNDLGYRFCTMAEFIALTEQGAQGSAPVCLLRTDVDSDPRGAAKMFDCGRHRGVRGTYYFRLATLRPALARQIADCGSEVGYHFEEIATVAKRLGLRSRAEIEACIDIVRDQFRTNVGKFRALSGVPLRTVASHGDFANRRLGVPNQELLTPALLDELGLVADAYDWRIHAGLVARFTDCPLPQWWKPEDPMKALDARPPTVSILVHPRQWTCNPEANLRLNVRRLGEEAAWRLRSACRTKQTMRAPRSAVR